MAIKSFAIPLDDNSAQSGDITFKDLNDSGTVVQFKITNITSGTTNELNLITSKNGKTKNHQYPASVVGSDATVNISHLTMDSIYDDALNGDWDYIEAKWTVGTVDKTGTSNNYEIQGGKTYNNNGWPPA